MIDNVPRSKLWENLSGLHKGFAYCSFLSRRIFYEHISKRNLWDLPDILEKIIKAG